MKTLAEIAADCDTDKEDRHRYCSLLYEELFAPYRDKAISLLEIGVYTGGSMQLWLEAFPGGRVFGVDISDDPLPKTARLFTFKADAYNPSFAHRLNLVENFDIIIDDGPHTLESQVAFLKLYGPHLREGGVMVIEDIQSPDYLAHFGEALLHIPHERHYVWDTRVQTGVYDNLCLIVKG